MNRRTALGVALGVVCSQSAWTQGQPTRQFPRNALRGVIEFSEPPEVLLNGSPYRLSPGARIRNANNMVVLSGTMSGSQVSVHYTLDNSGQLKDIWVLRDEELARKPWPKTPLQAQKWEFDAGNQTWTQP
ncbi:MAG: hypothetical protein B7Y51_05780 [Burkholderiales bacterium 28-67-8]|nr:MAG: hypothetical protein B7Y51_05780 [Burkholderiales bacterium 28-67-8]